jgi:ABC-2 type transport system ATP-binding protein
MSNQLACQEITIAFDQRTVIDAFTYEFDAGIYGIVGVNGSGKSTLLKVMAGVLQPDHGDVKLNGSSLRSDALDYKAQIGFAPDRLAFYPFVQVKEFWKMVAAAHRCDASSIAPLIEGFTLNPFLHTELCDLSLGTQKKVLLVAAFMSAPNVLLLDEPSDELDEQSTQFLIEELLTNRGSIVLLSSHDNEVLRALSAKTISLELTP